VRKPVISRTICRWRSRRPAVIFRSVLIPSAGSRPIWSFRPTRSSASTARHRPGSRQKAPESRPSVGAGFRAAEGGPDAGAQFIELTTGDVVIAFQRNKAQQRQGAQRADVADAVVAQACYPQVAQGLQFAEVVDTVAAQFHLFQPSQGADTAYRLNAGFRTGEGAYFRDR